MRGPNETPAPTPKAPKSAEVHVAHGTPVAAFFSSLLGQQLLEVFSVATSYALRTGRLPLTVLARSSTWAAPGAGSPAQGWARVPRVPWHRRRVR